MVATAIPRFDGRIPFVVFPKLTDTRPKAATASWEQLTARLRQHVEREDKDGPGWSGAVYRPGTTRANESVEAVTVLSFDFDHTEPLWELFAPYSYVAYTTFSHQEDDPHWRVVLPLAVQVTGEDYPNFWERAHYHLAPNADESCKDQSRFFYWPSCRPGAPHDSRSNEGAWLQPDSLPALPHVPLPAPSTTTPKPAIGGRPGDDYNARTSWPQVLEPHGWRLVYERGGEAYWRRPGKDGGTISATTNYKDSGLLYVFSSNAAPFEPGQGYSKFMTLALLERGGDVRATARDLAAKGYGDPRPAPAPPPATSRTATRETKAAETAPTIHLQSAAELLAKQFAEPRNVVDGVVYEGLSILAGRAKQGKSWMALGIAVAVAHGGYAFGTTKVEQGDVLYLALEDGERRLQKRLRALIGDQPAPERLTLATSFPLLDEGGLDALDFWLAGHPEARLVVIDTLKRFRPREKAGSSLYNIDYDALAPLSDLSHRYNVAIVVIHHCRKADAEDPLDLISGSTGLTGAADGAIVLKRARGAPDAELHVTHRDADDAELALQWDETLSGWRLLGDAEEHRRSDERNAVLRVLHDAPEPLTPKDLAEVLGKDYGQVKALLWKMANDKEIRSDRGRYTPIAPRPTEHPVSVNSGNPVDCVYPVYPVYPTDQPGAKVNGVNAGEQGVLTGAWPLPAPPPGGESPAGGLKVNGSTGSTLAAKPVSRRPADAISVQKDADHGGGYCTDTSHPVWKRQLRPGEKAWQYACVECWPQPEGVQ